jgi:hypothetical protein
MNVEKVVKEDIKPVERNNLSREFNVNTETLNPKRIQPVILMKNVATEPCFFNEFLVSSVIIYREIAPKAPPNPM